MRQKKTGRLANVEERKIAQSIVDNYRKAKESPDGTYSIGLTDDTEDPNDPDYQGGPLEVYFDGNDPAEAVAALAHFAKYGTFQRVNLHYVSILCLQMEFDDLVKSGVSRNDVISEIADDHHISTRSVERYLAMTITPEMFHEACIVDETSIKLRHR